MRFATFTNWTLSSVSAALVARLFWDADISVSSLVVIATGFSVMMVAMRWNP